MCVVMLSIVKFATDLMNPCFHCCSNVAAANDGKVSTSTTLPAASSAVRSAGETRTILDSSVLI